MRHKLLLAAVLVCAAFAVAGRTAPAGSGAPLSVILMQPQVWGPEFRAALATLPSWQAIGEKRVAVFADRLVGTNPYWAEQDAEPLSRRLALETSRPRPALKVPFVNRLVSFRTEPVLFIDDDSYRVAQRAEPGRLLASPLTFKQLENLIGPPEDVRVEIVHARGDRRPVDLTLHQYAAGALFFVESDLAPERGLVDRALLDVEKVNAVLFGDKR